MTNIYVQTHGCTTNLSESEQMMGLLTKAKFNIVDTPDEASLLIVNSCTVKGDETATRYIRKLLEAYPGKKMIVAGCVTKALKENVREITEDVSFVSTHNLDSIVTVVEEVLHDSVMEATAYQNFDKINIPRIRKNPVVGIIPILNSCAGYCSFCSVKFVKGGLKSYPYQGIITESQKSIMNGCKELWVTSQDNAAYMLDKKPVSELPQLLNGIIDLAGDFRIRVGMMNPEHVLKVIDPLAESFNDPKVFKFLHIPVQAGNDEILKLMRREYNVDEYLHVVKEMRSKIPNLTLATDIICGFPTETDEQFGDTLDLIKKIKPDVLNISRFHARPGTVAAKMDGQIISRDIKERSRALTELYHSISKECNEGWSGWSGNILIDEIGKNNTFVGRNDSYKPVVVPNGVLGEYTKVKIKETTTFDLRGVIV